MRVLEPSVKAVHHDDHYGKYCENHERQRNINIAKYNKRADNFYECNKKFFGTVVRKFRHVKEIVCDSRHDYADLCIVVVRKRQLLQMTEHVAAHVRFHFRAHYMTAAVHVIHCRGVYASQQNIQSSYCQYQLKRERHRLTCCGVCYFSNEQRQRQLADSGHGRAKKVENQNSDIRFVVRYQPFHRVQAFAAWNIFAFFCALNHFVISRVIRFFTPYYTLISFVWQVAVLEKFANRLFA